MLWPDHCVQNTPGAEFHSKLQPLTSNIKVIRKGTNPELDSYSAFFDNTGTGSGSTGLDKMLMNTTEVVVVGVATDFCVGSTTVDALQIVGLPATLLTDLSRAVAAESETSMLDEVRKNLGAVTTLAEWESSFNSWQHAEKLADYYIHHNSAVSLHTSSVFIITAISAYLII